MIRPEVTVVIPTHNRPSLLRQCLDAALHQRDVRHEVVIVDDGSDVPLALARHPRLTVVRHDRRRGVAAARNTGLARASARWVAFCDDDDVWAPHKLATQLAAMADQPGAEWSCCAAAFVNDELQLIAGEPAPGSGDVSELVCRMNAIPAGGSGVVADTAVVRRVGGFDPSLSMLADWDLWLRLATRGPVVSVPAALVAYRMHATAMSAHHHGTEDELARLEHKHAFLRPGRGVDVPRSMLAFWMAEGSQRGGSRKGACQLYLRSVGTVGPRAVLRAAEAFVWPGAYRLRDQRCRELLLPSWADEVESWLDPLRRRILGGGFEATGGAVDDDVRQVG